MELVRAVRAHRFGLVRPAASAFLHVGASVAGAGYRCAEQAHPHAGGRVALPPTVTVDSGAGRAARRPLGGGVLTDRKGRKEMGWVRGAAPGSNPALRLRGTQGSGAAIAPTIRECIEGREQAERALRRMQLEVAVGFVGASRDPRLKPALRLTVACFPSRPDFRYRYRDN